jgi:hypothetical protein
MLMAVCDFARPRVLVNFGMFSPAFWVSFFQLSSPRPRDIRSGIKHSSAEAVSWFSLVLLALRCEFNLQSNTGRLYLPGREEKERRVYLM